MKKPKTLTDFEHGRGYSKEDWDAVNSPELTDEELVLMKPAHDVLPKVFFESVDILRRVRGRPTVESPRKLVTLQLDKDIIDRFKADGKGWQTRINETLRKATGL